MLLVRKPTTAGNACWLRHESWLKNTPGENNMTNDNFKFNIIIGGVLPLLLLVIIQVYNNNSHSRKEHLEFIKTNSNFRIRAVSKIKFISKVISCIDKDNIVYGIYYVQPKFKSKISGFYVFIEHDLKKNEYINSGILNTTEEYDKYNKHLEERCNK